MKEITLILHGWSDCSQSFVKIKEFLVKSGIGNVDTIEYADYESREDSLSFEDIIDGLWERFIERGFIDRNGQKLCNLNIILHSTGGLIIRHWIWRYYRRDGDRIIDCPVKRIIMLAPANFGSPLAHRGKSFLGSLVAGRWKVGDLFEVGRQLLEGLELASPYQWRLAHADLLTEPVYFNARQIQVTILVGIEDYQGIKGWVNKPGTDGTVVIAGAPLNTAKLILDFAKPRSGTDPVPLLWANTQPVNDFAFAVLEGVDHGAIVETIQPGKASQAGGLLLEALKIKSDRAFWDFQEKLSHITEATYAKTGKPRFQQFILHAIDDQEIPIRDFMVDFFICKSSRQSALNLVSAGRSSAKEADFSARAYAVLTRDSHCNTQDSSFRRFHVDLQEMKGLLDAAVRELEGDVLLTMAIHIPDIDGGIHYQTDTLQQIVLADTADPLANLLSFFYENTTTLVELRVNRFNQYVTVGPEPQQK